MRRSLIATFVAAALLAPAAGASKVDARLLVLRDSDVPSGLRLDSRASRDWPNASFAGGRPQLRTLATRSGRVTGYTATYEGPAGTIQSLAHLCRTAPGAGVLYSALDAQQRDLNATRGRQAYRRSTVAVGDKATMYSSPKTPHYTLVLWRAGRAVGGLSTWGLGRDKTLALARAQQRRIENALG